MFFVVSKEKIISYVVALSTIVILLGIANMSVVNQTNSTIPTVAKAEKNLPVYSVATEQKKVALTINCAWNADDIDSILETLKNNQCKATFFMVGSWIDQYPEAVRKIDQAGHEVANHSDTHSHVNNLNVEKNKQEIKLAADKIEKITGKRSTLYRGPYGEYNDTVIKAAKEESHLMIQWSIDSLDYKDLTTEEMIKRIEPKLENGSIILMHNGTKNTANSLDKIIKQIKSKGYELTTVSDLVYRDSYYIDGNGQQHKQN